MTSSKDYQAAIDEFIDRNQCGICDENDDYVDIDISFDVVKQFSINRDGGTLDGELYIGDEPRWSAVCGSCGNEFELDEESQRLLTIIAEDFVTA